MEFFCWVLGTVGGFTGVMGGGGAVVSWPLVAAVIV